MLLRLLEKLAVNFLQLPCQHNEEEFQDILTWIRAKGGRPESKVYPPPLCRHFNGMEAPLICSRMGVSSSLVHERMAQVKLAMKDLLTFNRFVFPSMDTSSQDFAAYLEVMRTDNGFEAMQAEASS